MGHWVHNKHNRTDNVQMLDGRGSLARFMTLQQPPRGSVGQWLLGMCASCLPRAMGTCTGALLGRGQGHVKKDANRHTL